MTILSLTVGAVWLGFLSSLPWRYPHWRESFVPCESRTTSCRSRGSKAFPAERRSLGFRHLVLCRSSQWCDHSLFGHLIPYFTAKKARSLAGAACATSCHVEILSLVRSSMGFTHFITASHSSARSGLRASTRTQKEHRRA